MDNQYNIIKKKESQKDPEDYYNYLSQSQSMNIINTLTISQDLKNLEPQPQDNVKKKHQRQLLEKNQIKEEQLIKINNDNYLNNENKYYTAVKKNKMNSIFNKEFIEKNGNIYKFNFFRKATDDNKFLYNNKNNNLDSNIIYEKKNINIGKKGKSFDLIQETFNQENLEKMPMDNVKKRKSENNNNIQNNNKDNLVYHKMKKLKKILKMKIKKYFLKIIVV